MHEPHTTLDPRFSSPDAVPRGWGEAIEAVRTAGVAWLTTLRADGSPHTTPLIAVWRDGAVHFCTGATEQKMRNLERDPRCSLTTGCNRFDEGFDVVIEGRAERVSDHDTLLALATAWVEDHGEIWRFEIRDGAFWSEEGGSAPVFRIAPIRAFGFGKGASFSQTRWSFPA